MPTRSRIKPLFAALGLLLTAGWGVFAAVANLRALMLEWRSQPQDLFGASTWEPRVTGLREAIPSGAVVGYLSEKDLPGYRGEIGDQLEEMLLTQYFLAPRILVPGADFPLVIANFGRERVDFAAVEEAYGLHMIQELGGGIYLLEQAP